MFERLASTNDRTLTSYLSLLMTSGLSLWSNPAIDRATETSDFSFHDFRRTPQTAYFVAPPHDKIRAVAPLVRLFFSDLLSSLHSHLPGEEEPWPVMIMLDEFDMLGRMPSVTDSIKTLRAQASVIDGDTIEIRGERIRLASVVAPESRQTCLDARGHTWRCGQQAALALSHMIGRSPIFCLSEGRDQYDRILGQCRMSNVSLSAWLIENGWAVPYNDREGRHYPAAKRAEDARRGIWAGSFQTPSEWRNR